ncbi:MAG: methyl-accepting chemotaxis protein [Chthoniobacterales bacterium]|nr:methyl-accepting chemotaxis protein [Chthoniobacterales bacterium]
MKIRSKLNLPLILGLLLVFIVGTLVMYGVIKQQGRSLVTKEMLSIISSAEATRKAYADLHSRNAFAMKDLLAELEKVGKTNFRQTTMYETIPIVAAWKRAQDVAEKSGFEFRVVRQNPRNPKNAPNQLESEILKEVEKPGVKEFVGEREGWFIAARPIILSQDCLSCHGDPAKSPTGDGKDILGFPMENWREGEVRGAFILRSPVKPINDTALHATFVTMLWTLPVLILVILGSLWVINRSIGKPVESALELAGKVAKGDLTVQMEVEGKDELAQLGRALNQTTTQLSNTVSNIQTTAKEIELAANELTQTAASQAAGAEETTTQANCVASAGEEVATNAKNMARLSEKIRDEASSVAAAVEEMSASIREVAENCSKESEIAAQADRQAAEAKQLMNSLQNSAQQIQRIVDLINQIAGQTNLLALNATIEAASAGEAGRGFAVVANEIKQLARQSASASDDIRKQIAMIQSDSTSAFAAMEHVAQVINEVSRIATTIASAVEEQSATVAEIAKSLQNLSRSTEELNQNLSMTASGAEDVSRNISGVSTAAADTARGAEIVRKNATHLLELSSKLKEAVSKFKI